MDADCEKITPYKDNRDKASQVREMFDNIAPAYDFMNRAMTFGIDRLWRRRAVNLLRRHGVNYILDIATGTGDLAIDMSRRLDPLGVTGIDISEKMVEIGMRKVADADLADVVKLMKGDCMELSFPDESFDCVTVAYGVRNFENLARGYAEMYRVLKSGGIVCVLELSSARSFVVSPFYNLYANYLIPAVGKFVSNDARAYTYLPESIAAVPQGDAMLSIMRNVGFRETHCRRMTFGTCSLYTALK